MENTNKKTKSAPLDIKPVVIILFMALSILEYLYISARYNIKHSEWKCIQAKMIDNDPSVVECTVYKMRQAEIQN
jgi:hypothetical protein